MLKKIAQWIINIIGYALIALTIVVIAMPILITILFAIKSSGALNADSWDPKQRTHYEKVFKITIPESVEWVRFRERYKIFRGELYATPEEFAQLFPPERFPLEDLPVEEASFFVKECAIEYNYDIPHDNCSYKFFPNPYKEYDQRIRWKIVAEFPPDENERIHVWFVYF